MHAETMLLVDHHQRKVAEGDRLLEQRVRADENVDATFGERGKDLFPLSAFLAAAEERDLQSCRRSEAANRLEMLACQQLGRRHERGLRAGLHRGRHGEQGNDGLAAADVALQEPQHAVGIGEIGVDFRKRPALRAGELEGELGDNRLTQFARSFEGTPGAAPQALADHGERKLIGEQLVIGKPQPRRRRELEIAARFRRMHALERLAEARPGIPLAPSCIDPFRQGWQTLKRLGDDFAQGGIGETGGERIDRLEQRQLRHVAGGIHRDHVIRMRHLQPAVIGFELA